MINYEILRIIWWALMGIVLAGFSVMDGFDLGVAMLIPLAGRKDIERRVIINTVGPVWEGNQVWIVLGGGVLFAAWPYLYATSFSGFYLAIFLLLATFILRPVAFKYRSKMSQKGWRSFWDYALAICGFLSAVVFGVAIGNILQGVPFHFSSDLHVFYTGSFWGLFNGFAILCGVISAAMLMMHGGLYLGVKTEGVIRQRAHIAARLAGLLMLVLFAVAGILVDHMQGFVLTHIASFSGPSNPLYKTVAVQSGAWMTNYTTYPYFMIAPILGFTGALFAIFLANWGAGKIAFIFSGLSVIGVVLTVGVSMFPFIMPSSSDPRSSIIVWDSSASQLSLQIMLIVAIIFLPIILAYTSWVFRVLRGKVTTHSVIDNDQAY